MRDQNTHHFQPASLSHKAEMQLPSNIPAERLLTLLQASDDIMASIFHRSRQETLQTVVGSVKRLLEAEAAAIFLVSEDASQELVLSAYQLDKPFKIDKRRLPIQDIPKGGLTGYIAHKGEIVRLHGAELKNHPNNAGNSPTHLISEEGFSILGIPLKNRKGHVLGVVKVDNKKGAAGKASEAAFFDEVDEFIARVLIKKIILVLDSLRYSAALRTLMEAMLRARSLEDILNDILKTGMKLIGADRGDFAWWDVGKRQLVTAAQYGEGKLDVGNALPERSVVYEVWRTREPVLIGDVFSDAAYRDKYYEVEPSTRSEIAVCLKFGEKAIGVLNAESSRSHWFDEQDLELLQLLAQYATIATQVVGEEAAFHGIVQRITEHSPPREEILTDILMSVANNYGFDAGMIYIANYATRLLQCAAFIGCDEVEADPKTFSYGFDDTSLAIKVFQEGAGYFSADPKTDPVVYQKELEAFHIEGPLVGVPLIYRGGLVGVLVSWSRQNNSPTPEHIEILKPFATLAATIIAISELERQRTRVLIRIGDILNQMQAGMSLEKSVRLILTGIQEAGFDKVRIFGYQEETQSFVGLDSIGMKNPDTFVGYVVSIEKNPSARYTAQIWTSETKAQRYDTSRFGDDPDASALERIAELPWASVPLVTNGKLYGYIAADNGYSRREITEDNLDYLTLFGAFAGQAIANRQTIEVLRGSKLRDDFLQHLAHIFMTTTTSVEWMMRDLQDGAVTNAKFLQYYLPRIVNLNNRFLGLGQKIRDFAALRDDISLNIEQVDLIALTQDVIKRLEGAARARKVSIAPSFPRAILWWQLDKTRAANAIEALVENAIKFSLEGKTVYLQIEVKEQSIQVIVRDEGSGILEADLPYIFDVFFRGRNAKNAHVEGTGLGLSIVSRTMELHRGKRLVRNHPQGGAEFTLEFPRL